MSVQDVREQLRKVLEDVKRVAEAAEKEGREFTGEERAQVAKMMEEARGLKAKLAQAEGDAQVRQELAELGMLAAAGGSVASGGVAGRGRTLGEQFVEAPAFTAWLKQAAPGGAIPESARGLISPPVEFKTLLTGTSDTSAGAFVPTDVTGIYEPLGRRPLTVRDLISVRQTTSDLVEFVRQTAQVTQAAPTPESNVTTYSGGQGEVKGDKPEGAMAFLKVTAAVKTIAVWIPATKRALSDAAQLRGLIDQELRDDLEECLEDEIVAGDGSGEHFTGILNTSGVLTQSYVTDLLTTTRKAVTKLLVSGRSRPTAWLMHPNDAEAFDLLKDGTSRYYFGGPLEGGAQRLWRIPIVTCEAVTEGTAILGDFRKAVLWDRERATIQVSDSHADFFIRNMVAVLAEMRAAFGVLRPTAFCLVDLTA